MVRRAPNSPKSIARRPEVLGADNEEEGDRWFQHWGPCKREKEILNDGHLCNIGTHNINSFPDKNVPKAVRMMQTYKDMHVVGLSELNRNWLQMPEKDQIREIQPPTR